MLRACIHGLSKAYASPEIGDISGPLIIFSGYFVLHLRARKFGGDMQRSAKTTAFALNAWHDFFSLKEPDFRLYPWPTSASSRSAASV